MAETMEESDAAGPGMIQVKPTIPQLQPESSTSSAKSPPLYSPPHPEEQAQSAAPPEPQQTQALPPTSPPLQTLSPPHAPAEHAPLCCSIRLMIYCLTHIATAYVISLYNSFHIAWVCMTREGQHKPAANANATTNETTTVATSSSQFVDDKLDWHKDMQRVLFTAYPLGGVIFIVITGWIIDKRGSRVVCSCIMLLTGVVCALIPSAALVSPHLVFFCRLILGSSSMGYPLVYNVASHWVPKNEMGLAMSILLSGLQSGAFICMSVAGYQCKYYGWKSIFYTLGVFGVLYSVIWMLVYRTDPEKHPWISDKEKQYILEHRSKQHRPGHKHVTPWKELLSSPPVWAKTAAIFCTFCCVNLIAMFMPTLYVDVLQLDVEHTGLYSSLPFLGFFIGRIAVGPISDSKLIKEKCKPTQSVKSFNSFGMFGIVVATSIMAAILQLGMDPAFPVFLLSFALFGAGTVTAGCIRSPVLIAPHHSGVIGALGNSAQYISAILVPIVVVAILADDASIGRWRIVFVIPAVLAALGTCVFLAFGSGDLQSWDRIHAADDDEELGIEEL